MHVHEPRLSIALLPPLAGLTVLFPPPPRPLSQCGATHRRLEGGVSLLGTILTNPSTTSVLLSRDCLDESLGNIGVVKPGLS